MSFEPFQQDSTDAEGQSTNKNPGAVMAATGVQESQLLRELWILPCNLRASAQAVILRSICGVAT